jgi:Lrp/AsnC family leucine-responsive transcriptional regulator
MVEYSQGSPLDALDEEILSRLQHDGRVRNVELSRQVNLSPPAVHARIKRLEEEGFIQRYTAIVNRELLGFDMLCFIHLNLQLHTTQQVEQLRQSIMEIPEVLECHHVTGEFDYLLKVIVRNRKDLERFVVHRLTPVPGIARIHTSLVLTEIKHTSEVPLTELSQER